MNEVKRILNYWKEVNLLTPVTVKSVGFKNQKYPIIDLKIHY